MMKEAMTKHTQFVQSVVAMEGANGAPSGNDFSLALVDALIFMTMREAIKHKKSADDFMDHLMDMMTERFVEWSPAVPKSTPTTAEPGSPAGS